MLCACKNYEMNAEVLSENLQGRHPLQDQDMDERIICKWIGKKWPCIERTNQTQYGDQCWVLEPSVSREGNNCWLIKDS
jgi:hypothetical protein